LVHKLPISVNFAKNPFITFRVIQLYVTDRQINRDESKSGEGKNDDLRRVLR